MAARILYSLCALALIGSVSIVLVGYGELRGARECIAIWTETDGK